MKKIGLFYNLRRDYPKQEMHPIDIDGDWDVPETIQEIIIGLQDSGFEVLDWGDPKLLLNDSVRRSTDVVFSICEMQGYRFRESLVPCVCELLALPYVFSPPDTLMISLDKNLCNMLIRQAGCNVPDWYIAKSGIEAERLCLDDYPYIVKPSCEGSGIGITEHAVVYDELQLTSQVDFVTKTYSQPALIQKFLRGREFTIGVIEDCGRVIPLEPLELCELHKSSNFTYNYSIKEDADQKVVFKPLKSEPELYSQICKLATQSFEVIGCRDAARVDIRLSDGNIPFFLEINPLPHLHPRIGDFCRSAKASGYNYESLLAAIVKNALCRYDLE